MQFGEYEYDEIMDNINEVYISNRTSIPTQVEVNERIIRELTEWNENFKDYERLTNEN